MVQVRVVDSTDLSNSSARFDLTRRFETFVGALEEAFGLSLPIPRFADVVDIKKFCSGLLEGQSDHPWRQCLKALSASSRMSISFSLFLFRKCIPSERPLVGPYVERMCTPQDPPDPEFLSFARGTVRRLFRFGWDRSYLDKCSTSTLPITACYESGRSQGGCRGLDHETRWSREDFCSYVTESVAPRARGPSRVQAIYTDKWRTISIPPRVDNALRPLHSCLYDKISSFKWCLRGDAKPSRFGDFSSSQGEVFVSGDYESATDNLNSVVQYTILEELLKRAVSVPSGIKRHALSTFSSVLEGPDGVSGEQQRGQLMGQLCSFPLLCLVNYITFKYFVPRDVPVRINGDDIVFRATPEECERWSHGVAVSGLTLSRGKTLVHGKFFSLNSSMFRATATGARWVPFVRPKTIWSDKERMCERISSLSSRYYSMMVGFGRGRGAVFKRLFLVENSNTILRSRRSLTRGLGMKVSEGVLRDSGLWNRELFYLEHVDEPPLPHGTFAKYCTNDTPPGWVRVSKHRYPREVLRGWSYRFAHGTVARAWTQPVVTRDSAEREWMADCDAGCSTWGLQGFVTTKMRKLTKMSRRELWRYVCLRRNSSFFGRVRFVRGKGEVKPGVDLHVQDDGPEQVGKLGPYRTVAPPAILLS